MRHHMTLNGPIPFTAEEEAEWDAREAQELIDRISREQSEVRAVLKRARAEAVENIKVTTQAGHTFDGDEVSQGRMARAILWMQAADAQSITWVLADNSVIQASAAELAEALALAGAAQAAIWVLQ